MWQLVSEGRDPQQRSKQRLEPGQTYVLGRSGQCDIPVPWEPALSRRHLQLRIHKGEVTVEKLSSGRNPVFYGGEALDRFSLSVGERFVVGETTFSMRETQPLSSSPDVPVHAMTFSNADLAQVRFEDSDRRLEALVHLPDVIGNTNDEEERAAHLVGLILAGIRHAEAVAVVRMNRQEEIEVVAWERRTETEGSFRPSSGLIRDAVHDWKSVLHVWENSSQQNNQYTISSEFDWAFCTPVGRSSSGSWGIYVAGRLDQPLFDGHPLQRNLQSDVRFTQLIGEVIGSADRVNRLEGQLSVLRQFLSPPILDALEATGHHGELNIDLLQPRVCEVTVLFCDLRGFSQHAEESVDDLPGLLGRVNSALEEMTSAILKHGGVTGDFLGDAVLGFWGWPFASEESPLKACRAALAIRERFARLESAPDHPLSDFRVGIGVAHGQAVAGKIGTGGRISVTVFGPVVNLASRLEGMTKRLRVPVILDEATAKLAREGLSPDEGRVRELATVVPYGMETPLTVSELVPPQGEFSELTDAQLATFEKGVQQFRAGRWEEAYRALHEIPSNDHAQDFLLSLITQHNRTAPLGWKGVIELPGK